MKLAWVPIVAVGLLSSGSAQAFQGLAARLSLDHPYRSDVYHPVESGSRMDVYPPNQGARRRLDFRQADNPESFNIFRYMRFDNGGVKVAVSFK